MIEQFLVGLTEEGNRSLDAIARSFPYEWRMGEAMLNRYLTTGTMLPLKEAMKAAIPQSDTGIYKRSARI